MSISAKYIIDKTTWSYIFLLSPLLYPLDTFMIGVTPHFVALILLCAGCFSLLREKTFAWKNVDAIFLLFLVYYAFTTLGKEASVDTWRVCLMFGTFLLFVYARHSSLKSELLHMLLFAGILQTIWFWLQYFQILPSHNAQFDGTGVFFNPAMLAITLVLSSMAGICIVLRTKRNIRRLFSSVLCASLLFTLSFLHSRAAWVALFSGLSWLLLTDEKCRHYRKSILCALLLILPVLLYVLYNLRPSSAQGRLLIWQVSKDIFLTHPLLGNGLFSSYMPAQGEWLSAHQDSPFTLLADDTIYAFNEPVRIACETGVIGLLLFLGLLTVALYCASRGTSFSRCSGGILCAMSTFGLFSYPLAIPWLVAVATIILGIIFRDFDVRTYVFRQDKSFIFVQQLSICLLMLVFFSQYYHCKRADIDLKRAQTALSTATSPQLAACYEHFSGNSDFVLCYAKTLYNHQQYLQAIPVLQQAYEITPLYSIARDLGICYQKLCLWTKAEEQFQLASRLIPGLIFPRISLLRLYQQTRQDEKAEKTANDILTCPVKKVSSSVLRARIEAKEFLKKYRSKNSLNNKES